MHRHIREASCAEQRRHRFALIVAMLNDEHAVRLEVSPSATRQLPIALQPVHRIGQRDGGLEAQIALSEMCVTRRDVRRVAQDQVEPRVGRQRGEPVGLGEGYFRLQALRVVLCER